MTLSLIPLPPLVACVDSNEDVVLLLRDCMVDAGYRSVTFVSPIRYGAQPVIDFITYLVPAAAIFNVSPPYEQSWAEYRRLVDEAPECPMLPVTTNKAALELVVGPTDALEVLATADDLEDLVGAVRTLLSGRVLAGRSLDGRSPDGAASARSFDGAVGRKADEAGDARRGPDAPVP